LSIVFDVIDDDDDDDDETNMLLHMLSEKTRKRDC
jgi:hypothetical protein